MEPKKEPKKFPKNGWIITRMFILFVFFLNQHDTWLTALKCHFIFKVR